MQPLMRWALLAFVLALSTSVAPPARASFGECSNPDYLARFDERFRSVEYDCVERLRVPVSTADGTRSIRILHDFNADWIVSSGEMREFERGVTLAAAAIPDLGRVHLEDITVLLADDFPPRDGADDFSNIAAWTEMTNDGECLITVYLVGPASRPEFAASVVAHEIFHCVQTANLTEGQINSPGGLGEGGGGNWWLEGSATWFNAYAVPEVGPLRQFINAFDEDSPTVPLNRMAYEALPFWLWLGAETSASNIMNFLHGMAESGDESAQRRAMMAALPQERWLEFAQAYLDGEIRHPHGADLGFSVQEGESWTWSATRTQNVPAEPFQLIRAAVSFECGRWRTGIRPDSAYRVKPSDGGDWEALPTELDTATAPDAYRFVAMNAATSRVTLSISGTKESGCAECGGSREINACLVGTWQLTGGGPADWMRAQGIPGNFSTSNQTITLRRDGTYITSAMSGSAEIIVRDNRRGGTMGAQAGGRWSVGRDGTLNMCADMQNFSTTETGGPPGPGNLQMSYTCGGGTMTTIQPMPRGAPPMSSSYSRIGE